MKRIFSILCILILCKACTPISDLTIIQVFVAASLSPVVTELGELYQDERNIKIVLNTASSGTLARQIAQGASADLFISANQQWITYLQNEQLIFNESTLPIINQLVLVAPIKDSHDIIDPYNNEKINDLLQSNRLAIGDPNHVPVGQYALQAIEALNWQLSSKQTLPSKDARATLVAVELGEAELGIVYQTDAKKSKKVNIIGTLPKEAYAPIRYFAGTCSNNPLTAEFLIFMNSPEARQIWEKHGFIL
ncbi:MAG: molybdate ABC transporter substrate-binding protein [Cytophagales bacterium]|nr:molybdate ABC transporter substrate-binding protein [Cytophagales bacterium]